MLKFYSLTFLAAVWVSAQSGCATNNDSGTAAPQTEHTVEKVHHHDVHYHESPSPVAPIPQVGVDPNVPSTEAVEP